MAANRTVALFTPVFTAAAALGSGALAKYGLNVSPAEIVAVETTAGVAAASAALKWLHGWSVYEKLSKEAETDLASAEKYGVKVPSEEEISALVQKHVGESLLKLAAAIPAPAPVPEPAPTPVERPA